MAYIIGLCCTKPTKKGIYMLKCFGEGLEKHGDRWIWIDNIDAFNRYLSKIDVAAQVCFEHKYAKVVAGTARFRRILSEATRKIGKRIITLDTGFLNNQPQYELTSGKGRSPNNPLFDKNEKFKPILDIVHYEIGYDGLKNYATHYNSNSPPDRWQKLGLELKPWRTEGKHILILGQTVNGQSCQHLDLWDWFAKTIKIIRSVTQRPIVIRLHPRVTKIRNEKLLRTAGYKDQLNSITENYKYITYSTNSEKPIDLDFKDCWAAVGITTNASVLAPVEGIPIFATDPGNMAWPISAGSLELIENPNLHSRDKTQQWLNNLCYAQWTCNEMKSGEVWAHLRPHVKKSLTYRMP